MNATPTGRKPGDPDPDGAGHDDRVAVPPLPPLPAPRSGTCPLPRRRRAGAAPSDGPGTDARDPDGRPYEHVDDETLGRLLSGLRDI